MKISIYSTNPELMSILLKNPNSFGGIQLREMKFGVAIGRVISPNQYDMLFQDTKYSFSEDMSNQIDFQSYCNPRVALNLFSTFLRHLLVDRQQYETSQIPWLKTTAVELDQPGKHVLTISNVYADGFSSERGFVLNKYFPGVNLQYKHGQLYSLTIESEQSVFHLLNLASLVMVYIAANNRQHWFLGKDMVAKYLRILHNLKPVPYFVLYLLARNCIQKESDFLAFKTALEACSDQSPNMTWGNTQQMRIREVGDRLLVDGQIPASVIEIGSGEMDYPRTYLKALAPDAFWWSHDLVDYGHLATKVRERSGVNNFAFVQDLDAVDLNTVSNPILLMVEVIEHMPLEQAKEYVHHLLTRFKPRRVIMTTPNRNFNRHFEIDGFRHDDHQFEFTPAEFLQFIREAIPAEMVFEIQPFEIGDVVGGDCLTLGIELNQF